MSSLVVEVHAQIAAAGTLAGRAMKSAPCRLSATRKWQRKRVSSAPFRPNETQLTNSAHCGGSLAPRFPVPDARLNLARSSKSTTDVPRLSSSTAPTPITYSPSPQLHVLGKPLQYFNEDRRLFRSWLTQRPARSLARGSQLPRGTQSALEPLKRR